MNAEFKKFMKKHAPSLLGSGCALERGFEIAFEAGIKAERKACAGACRSFGKTLEDDIGERFAEEIMARDKV